MSSHVSHTSSCIGRSQVQELGGVVFQLCRTIQTPVNSISLSQRKIDSASVPF